MAKVFTTIQKLLAEADMNAPDAGSILGIGYTAIDTRFESTFDIIKNFAFNKSIPNIFGNSDTADAIVLRSEPDLRSPPAPSPVPSSPEDPSDASANAIAPMGVSLIAYCKTINSRHTTLLPDPQTLDPTNFRSQALISAFPKFRYSALNLMGVIPPGTVVSVTFDPGSLQSGVINLPMAPACIDCPSGSAAFPGAMGPFAGGWAGPASGRAAIVNMKGIDPATHKLYTTLLPGTPTAPTGQRIEGDDLNGLTSVVLSELAFWGGKKEDLPAVYPRLKMYWDNLNYKSWTPGGTAWSAAYISYVLTRVDPQFPKSSGHYYYAASAKKKKGNWSLFATRNSNQIKAQIGDVLVKARSGKPTNTHGDAVYKIEDGKAWLTGGNLGNTAKGNVTLALDASQNYATYGSYEVILKKNGRVVPLASV